ncbi:hypothetical protein BAUCODRAFT_145992 [Baudoinia panamericana UAMH 10762]|uniref:NAD(P)-binding domain-containing protein n=1 Tax=Baudoinia panamericana (strain UAMH 10762) TaxID=717646 RepID=M2NIU7_BAUPA|nr:uncharacterized protein BAUCODRAFT_145992 [Baudoinia panamericana UAMH 10762]EMC99005.1 hypothetical protein BAUCODRAFT_145992 [Baudoinia panamericana UAMH 10762]
MSMMRVAVAGTCGLARLIAYFIQQDTGHQVVLLSRQERPELSQDYQVSVVDYSSLQSLQFALRGIDTVISTVTGQNQIELIRAAVSVRVRRFAPAEFEGLPELRPANDPLDRGRTLAQQWLHYYAQHMQSTTFVCGILYERFQPGGLLEAKINRTPGFAYEGDYMLDCRAMSGRAPAYNAANAPDVTICMTAAQDVGKFVTKAIDMPQWPRQLKMCGQRITVKNLVRLIQRTKGQVFDPLVWHGPGSLHSALQLATAAGNAAEQIRLHTLIATAEGRYDFTQPDLNNRFPEVQTIPFRTWFIMMWRIQG